MNYEIKNCDIEIIESCLMCQSGELTEISNVCEQNELVFLATSCCKECGFVFRSRRPKLEWFLNAWSIRKDDSATVIQNLTKNTDLETMRYDRYKNLAIVLEDCVTDKNILDIGCGPGTGLKAFVDRGWDVTGVEPDPVRAKVGMEHCNLNIHNCTIENFMQPKQYDVIILIHTLEHIHNPKDFIQSAIDKMVDGGYLYIEVPDLFNFVSFEDSLYLEHMNNFSNDTLQTIGKDLDLFVKKTFVTKTNPHGHDHIAVLFQKDKQKQWQNKNVNINKQSYGMYVKQEQISNLQDIERLDNDYIERVKKIYRKTGYKYLPSDIALNISVQSITDIGYTCKKNFLTLENNKLKVS